MLDGETFVPRTEDGTVKSTRPAGADYSVRETGLETSHLHTDR